MRKFALALAGGSIALTGLVATPASAADFGGHDRGRFEQVQNRGFARNGFVANNRFEGRSWNRSDRFDNRYAMNDQAVSYPGYYGVRPAPYGYRWARSGNNTVLVAIAGGIIGSLLANAR